MKLSDINGTRQIQVVGKLMTLADSLKDDENFKEFMSGLQGKDKRMAVFKLGPLLERKDVASSLVQIVAYANGISVKEAEKRDILSELMELLTSDVELPAFLSEQQ